MSRHHPSPTAPHDLPDALAVLGGDVDVVTRAGDKVAYANLDYAATAPCLRAAADAVAELLPSYAQRPPGRRGALAAVYAAGTSRPGRS